MATTQIVSALSGTNCYYLLRLKSNQKVWNGASFATWSDGSIASYDLAGAGVFDDKGGDIWLATLPTAAATAAGTDTILLIGYYYTVNGAPAITDTKFPTIYEIGLFASSSGSPSVSANQTTVGELRTILMKNSRNAGIIDSSNVVYSLETADYAIQGCLEQFIESTKITHRTDTLTMSSGASTIDFSSLVGFGTDRLLGDQLWAMPSDGSSLNSCEPDVEVISLKRIDTYRANYGVVSGHPGAIGFDLNTGSNTTAQNANKDYTVRLEWFATLSAWTPGDSGDGSTLINFRGDAAREIVRVAGEVYLQGQEIEHLPITDRRRIDWDKAILKYSSKGNLGVRSLRRMSVDEYRRRRYQRPW